MSSKKTAPLVCETDSLTEAPNMFKVVRILILLLVVAAIPVRLSHLCAADGPLSSTRWQITSVKVCRTYLGSLDQHIEVLGHFPVYSFFIPRPVWTVNGSAVEAQPLYSRGSLRSFKLLYSSRLLKSGGKNTVKLSLPDQHTSKTFRFLQEKVRNNDCFEFF